MHGAASRHTIAPISLTRLYGCWFSVAVTRSGWWT